ncbi:MAG TPA: elongation factor G, partial [Candidatus Brocadiia bacterium]|nr:elongation factor G [Candidatus Brocadiia bacterium]
MADYAVESLRNIAVVGHNAAGKTTLVEHLLFKAGRTNRLGSVDDKTSILDYEDQERERRVTIDSALAWLDWKKVRVNFIDCPGSLDFVADAIGGLQVVETAVITIAAPAGIELNTRRMWKASAGRARIIVITKMDADNITDHAATLAKIQEVFGAQCVPVNMPVGVGASFKGVASVLAQDQQAEGIEDARTQLMDVIAESDEALMERYLNEEKISPEEIAAALRKAVAEGKVAPVFHCSGRSGVGLEELLDGLAALAPSPLDAPARKGLNAKDGSEIELKPDPAAPLVAQVFKSLTDPFVGKLAYFRVLSGTFKADSTVYNSRSGRNERVGQVLKPFGKDTETTPGVIAGDFGAVSKIDDIQIGDAFCVADRAVKIPAIKYPTPMVSLAVMPRSRNDEQKIGQSVAKLATECPTFIFNRDAQTHELVVTGMSQRHVDVMIARLKSRFQVEVDTKEPKIPYKETISAKGEAQYRHKKQTGGSGQFAEVWLKVEPLERGAGFEFVDEIVGGAIPNQFIPAVEKGVREQM